MNWQDCIICGHATTAQGSDSNGIYEKADYHGNKNNAIKNKAPNKGQEAKVNKKGKIIQWQNIYLWKMWNIE